MSESPPSASAPTRERPAARSAPNLQPADLGAVAAMCRAVGDERRLRLFLSIAAASEAGVETVDAADREGLATLVDVGVVTPVRVAGKLRYRAEPELLRGALLQLLTR